MEEKLTTKEYLQSIRKKDYEILALEEAVLRQETLLTRVTPILSDMPRGGSDGDKMADGIARLVELKNKINAKIDETCREKQEVIDDIKKIKESSYRTILYERYINYRTFEEISTLLHYSYFHTCKLHGYALQEYEKMTSRDK